MNKKYKILVVDDMKNFREMVKRRLIANGFVAEAVEGGREAIELLKKQNFNIVFLDIMMPKMGGLEALQIIKKDYPDVYVIIITATAYADTETIVRAIKLGADDFVIKAEEEELIFRINKAIEKINLTQENVYLKKEWEKEREKYTIIGKSKELKKILDEVKKVAKTTTPVLIEGEMGTGKELIARQIHNLSDRKDKPFIIVNCPAIPENLIESELFGYEKGAFTGADKRKKGQFELADGGTILLDEIGKMSLSAQSKILRVVEYGQLHRIGGEESSPITVDVRIIATTNMNLDKLVSQEKFLPDLLSRLKVFPIQLPPLRARKDDIPLLLAHFLDKYNYEIKKDITNFSESAKELLMKYDYPGNVRELKSIIERAVILTEGDIILPEVLPQEVQERKIAIKEIPSQLISPISDLPANKKYNEFEDSIKEKVLLYYLIKNSGIQDKTAENLQTTRLSIANQIKKFKIKEKIMIALINHKGDTQALAKAWKVIEYKNELDKLFNKLKIKELLKATYLESDNDISLTAKVLKVSEEDLKESLLRLNII